MEEFHRSQVRVQVLEAKRTANYYSRRILLDRESDDRVVQFGIVRLNFDLLSPEVIKSYSIDDPTNPQIFRRGNTANAEPAVPGWKFNVNELFS